MGISQLSHPVAMQLAKWPAFTEEQITAAAAVLRSGAVNYWTGTEGTQFEKEFAAYTGCRHAVAVANGTVALELALRAMGIGPGDEVITTCRTFIASASCVVTVGALPVLADVDAESQNMTAETIAPLITARTRAIIVVHLAGWPCDMDPILELAAQHNLRVIEDCAQAHGARYKGRPVGSIGDIGAFSFCQDKIMTTAGEGGMIVTSDDALRETAWAYKDHGKSIDAVYRRQHPPGFRWLHESFGTNWRLTEVQAAVGRVALRHLDESVSKRREHAAVWNAALESVPSVRLTIPPESVYHSYYKYYLFVRPEKLGPGWSRDRIMCEISEAGVPCTVGSCSEIYRERAFAHLHSAEERLPLAAQLGETSLMFQVHPTLTEEQTQWMTAIVRDVLEAAAR